MATREAKTVLPTTTNNPFMDASNIFDAIERASRAAALAGLAHARLINAEASPDAVGASMAAYRAANVTLDDIRKMFKDTFAGLRNEVRDLKAEIAGREAIEAREAEARSRALVDTCTRRDECGDPRFGTTATAAKD